MKKNKRMGLVLLMIAVVCCSCGKSRDSENGKTIVAEVNEAEKSIAHVDVKPDMEDAESDSDSAGTSVSDDKKNQSEEKDDRDKTGSEVEKQEKTKEKEEAKQTEEQKQDTDSKHNSEKNVSVSSKDRSKPSKKTNTSKENKKTSQKEKEKKDSNSDVAKNREQESTQKENVTETAGTESHETKNVAQESTQKENVTETAGTESRETKNVAQATTEEVIESYYGVVICSDCVNSSMHSETPPEHTIDCCLMDSCIASGFGVAVNQNGKWVFYLFDENGQAQALSYLRKTTRTEQLYVSVTGNYDGRYLYVNGFQEAARP